MRFIVLFVSFLLAGSSYALANDGVKVEKGRCDLRAIQDYIKSTTFKGADVCEGMANPSPEQNRCLEQLGNGSFDNGVKAIKKRKTYNAWASGVVVQIDFAKEKVGENALNCKEWVEVINDWTATAKSGSFLYPHKQEAKRLTIKADKVQFDK